VLKCEHYTLLCRLSHEHIVIISAVGAVPLRSTIALYFLFV